MFGWFKKLFGKPVIVEEKEPPKILTTKAEFLARNPIENKQEITVDELVDIVKSAPVQESPKITVTDAPVEPPKETPKELVLSVEIPQTKKKPRKKAAPKKKKS